MHVAHIRYTALTWLTVVDQVIASTYLVLLIMAKLWPRQRIRTLMIVKIIAPVMMTVMRTVMNISLIR